MSETTSSLRKLWKTYECREGDMVLVAFGPDKIRVAPPTGQAWDALASVLLAHRYDIRTTDTDSYNCRNVKGTNQKSLHSYGIALDVNWSTNPWRATPDKRKVRFSKAATQAERADDVRLGVADTDMTPAMIADVLAIKTTKAKRVFEWGGAWDTVKDPMHFELDLGPADLEGGIDRATVVGWDTPPPAEGAVPDVVPLAMVGAATSEPHVVIARGGLNLRSGPGTGFGTLRLLAEGTVAHVLGRQDGWALVDLEGDGRADGFAFQAFLRTGSGVASRVDLGLSSVAAGRNIVDLVTPAMVKTMFPHTPEANIARNLPFVLAGLVAHTLTDRDMVLMALSTIRAETEGFVPIDEGVSRYNTRDTPFDLYDAGTPKGRDLGNVERGDGPRFKGRGYVQLTGRDNYTRIGRQVGADLVRHPDRANDPATAGLILARFLANKESVIRAALSHRDLRAARKAVNGGSHGLDRFIDAFERGGRSLPA